MTCPEGTVPVEVHGNAEKGEKGNGKAAKPLKKETQTTRYLYDGLTNVVANEYGQNGQDVAQYYRSQRDIVARKQFGLKGLVTPGQEETLPMAGGLKYYHPDLRGSVSALTDPKGQMVEQYRYDAFGGLFTGITAPYNTSGLNGHEFDPASGLVDMKARWYAPQNGRFLTPDTWRGTLEEPWTQNKYAYAGNNPVTRWDPTGNFSCALGEHCQEEVGENRTNWYFFQGKRPGPSNSRLVDSWTDLNGIYRSYEESTTTYYDYWVLYITWVDRSKGQATWTDADVTYSRTTHDSYTTFQPHTQDSRNEDTEDYREARTGPMPGEREISRETTSLEESELDSVTGEWVELVRPPVAGSSTASQVVVQVVAQATGAGAYTVQSGDSLWAIAERLYGDGSRWQEIAGANPQLTNPYAIYAGQVLNLPGAPTIPAQSDWSMVQQGEYSDAMENLDFTAYPGGVPTTDSSASGGSVLSSITKAPGALASSLPDGWLGLTPYRLRAVDPNPAVKKTTTLILQDIRLKNQNILRVDGPHMYKGDLLGWHLNVDRPSAVPQVLKGADHVNMPGVAQKLAPLTSASNLSKISKGATVVSVGIDTVRLGSAFAEDGYTVGKETTTTAGSVAGGWVGAWAGAKGGAAGGAAVGAFFGGPVGAGVGALIGGIGGAIGGGMAGSWVGEKGAERLYDSMQ